ncbi:MAG: glycogen debranching protein, partial [Cytophagales bacterium]|nr:glycogen debranching protein [Cytophagales bacterium]
DYLEDLFTHGFFTTELKRGDKICITITIEPEIGDGWVKIEGERKRRKKLNESMVYRDEFTDLLAQAADKFVVRRGSDLKSIIAGYHWFSDWGRDTMISLPGLCLVTGRSEDAKKILKAFAISLNKGLIPNRFPDYGEEPEYNTVDATLWFFNATYEYWKYTGDLEFIKNELLPVLSDSIQWHIQGTHHNIHMDSDGLLYSGEQGQQLTWMDAKCDDWVVTPREGKVVEINALWYNALKIMEHFSLLVTDQENLEKYRNLAQKVKDVFVPTFQVPFENYLFDYVDGDYKDYNIRPNMVFALSLPFPVVEPGELAVNIIRIIEDKLLTPIGLRSLDPNHLCYVGIYKGNQRERDGSYHQGTVWSWLLGHYFTAKIRIQGEKGRLDVEKFLENFQYHFLEAGIGNVSEIFDGDAPFTPKGCVAQAWGVAEILRAYIEDVKGIKK